MRRATRKPAARALGAALALGGCMLSGCILSGCMVGPDFERPKPVNPPEWEGLKQDVAGASVTSKPVPGVPELTRWWTGFNDPELNALIERAAIGNLDLVAAEARLRQARARRGIAFGGLFPSVDVFGSAQEKPDFGNSTGPIVSNGSLFTAGFDANWEVDIFGRIRRGIEVTDAGIDSALDDRRAVWVTLAAEVASTYVQVRASQQQLHALEANLAAQRDTQGLTRRLYEVGLVGALDVANSTAQVEATTSRLPPYVSAVREGIYTLGILLGQAPGTLLAELGEAGPIPAPPAEIPVGLPSDLLERRPDIRRAEAELHAATARIGVAVGDQFPRLTLTSVLGTQATSLNDLSNLATKYWSAGAGVTFPIFTAGRLQANVELQKAATDEALADYRKKVLVAFKETETAMVRFTQEQARRAALARTVDANRDAVRLSSDLYTAGRTDFLNVLATQRALLDSMEALAASDRAVADQSIALYKALGGGWDVPAPTAQDPSTAAGPPAPTG